MKKEVMSNPKEIIIMQLIKRIIQDELDTMNHEPELEGFQKHPEINWENVYQRMLDELESHIDLDSLPDDIHLAPKEIIEAEIEQAKNSDWLPVMVEEARSGYRERMKQKRDPYSYFGIARTNF